jgi:hypothetical protein
MLCTREAAERGRPWAGDMIRVYNSRWQDDGEQTRHGVDSSYVPGEGARFYARVDIRAEEGSEVKTYQSMLFEDEAFTTVRAACLEARGAEESYRRGKGALYPVGHDVSQWPEGKVREPASERERQPEHEWGEREERER